MISATAVASVGGDIGIGSWGPLLLIIAPLPYIVTKVVVFHTIEIETTANTTQKILHSDVNKRSAGSTFSKVQVRRQDESLPCLHS